ncbi:hypothetical protein EW026_g7995 [Hermanssonia centrifuga]|uniref:Uncharacterized protein n=1 Tax=Hermanssonia centrifuga TaxID=98765 RepID=A0A4S4K5Z8_9APHY|nr:hypothetical protein EW026_g7995 [Hermanssonia centrifuga]
MASNNKAKGRHVSNETRNCRYCGGEYNLKGLGRHQSACLQRQESNKREREAEVEREQESKRARLTKAHARSARAREIVDRIISGAKATEEGVDTDIILSGNPNSGTREPPHSAGPLEHEDDFFVGHSAADALDYAAIGSPVAEPLVGGRSATCSDEADPETANDNPEECPATIEDDPASLENDDIKMQYHPSTGRPPVISHFEDFQRHRNRPSHVNPNAFEDEPWKPFQTREDFDFAEVCLEAGLTQRQVEKDIPEGGVPLAFYLYADKTRLSSFGSQQGYPVVLRFPQLDCELRNGAGVGGGIVVGLLPILKEKSKDKKTDAWKDLKGVVWHESFRHILSVLKILARVGFKVRCGDGIERWLFPIILILSADYEEQCVMALTRGVKSHFPCPICLVPSDPQKNVSETYPQRTPQEAQDILAKEQTKAEREADLKKKRVCGILRMRLQVSMVLTYTKRCRLTDCMRITAGSSAPTSSAHSRNNWRHWGDNPRLLLIISEQFPYDTLHLHHFDAVSNVKFTDAGKYEDISKLIVLASSNVILEESCPEGYALLKLIRKYVELDMYLGFEVHTDDTLNAFEARLLEYEELLLEYQEYYENDPTAKCWDFPKAHTHKHVVRDIRSKGVTRNYNTKPNEKMHGPLKKIYLRRTNFKQVEKQSEPQLLVCHDNSSED